MTSCTAFDPLVERMLADEIDTTDRDRLLEHAQGCASCRQFVELHHRLLASEADFDLPDPREFATMRSAVIREIRARRTAAERAPRHSGWWGDLALLFARPAPVGAAAAALGLTLLVGLFVGHRWGAAPVAPLADGVLSRLVAQASDNRQLADVENSPWRFSNVSFDRIGDGTIELSFDAARRMQIRRPVEDPLVKEVLAHSLLDPSSVGGRLAAVGLAGTLIDPKLKQALIVTALEDPSQAVRQRALDMLAPHGDDPDVQSAMFAVLAGEASVKMRLQALDCLAASDVSGERFDQAVEDLRRQGDEALLVRAEHWTPVRPDDRAATREMY